MCRARDPSSLRCRSLLTQANRPFGYVYTPIPTPRASAKSKQWITRRHGQSRGDFDLWQFRTELEYGVSDNLQTALYLNYDSVNAFRNRPDDTTGPGAFVPDRVDPNARYKSAFSSRSRTSGFIDS